MLNPALTKMGTATHRIDGPAKVTGTADYPADNKVDNPAWAYLVTSSIARGNIKSIDLAEARKIPGVLDILTYENVSNQAEPPDDIGGGKPTTKLQSKQIWHAGQIIGVVLADSYEIAREAARAVHVDYDEETPAASFDSQGTDDEKRGKDPQHEDYAVGDAENAFENAAVKIDQAYETPTQHHNALELFTTTCVWNGDHLTVYEPSQSVYGLRAGVAKQLNIDQKNVTVISRFIGGGFGGKGLPTARTAWIAIAARRLGRPVKLVPTRDQGFTIATYRAETRHRLRLAADNNGKLQALIHEGWEVTSRPSNYNVSGGEATARMYACPNIKTEVNLVHADRSTPGFMRAPAETPYMFALESAVDELAYALNMDPIELRRVNDTQTDPTNQLPYSSRSLMKCYDAAAARFNWKARNPKPASMRDGDWLIGYGCASAFYPSSISPAAARVTVRANGTVLVEIAGHDLGTGAYTAVALAAADKLGISMDKIEVLMGTTNQPAAGIAGGSIHTASICNAVVDACTKLRAQLETTPIAAIPGGKLEVYAEHVPQGLPEDSMKKVAEGGMAMLRGTGRKDYTTCAFGAHFIELRVHARTAEIRMNRMISAFASGKIVNPLTAYSQYMGGMIWGISSALHEKTEIDSNAARYVNDNFADYLVPVNADIQEIDVMMVSEDDDKVNPLGIKGIGEVGIVGANAAVANAVFHATGRRIRRLPIRIEDLI